jgi:hypothetical protein
VTAASALCPASLATPHRPPCGSRRYAPDAVLVTELLLLTLAAAVCDTLAVAVSDPLAETEALAETVPVGLEVGEGVPLPVALADAEAVTDPVLDCVASALRLTLAEAPMVGLPDRDAVGEPVPVIVLEALRLLDAELEPEALLLRLAEALPVPVSVAVAEELPVKVLVLLMLAAAVPVMLGDALSEALAVREFVAEAVPLTVLVAAKREAGAAGTGQARLRRFAELQHCVSLWVQRGSALAAVSAKRARSLRNSVRPQRSPVACFNHLPLTGG